MVASALPASALMVSQPGDAFLLGTPNHVDARTTLRGTLDDTNLRIVNQGTGRALALFTEPGVPPLQVNQSTRVPKLNADRIDDWDANQLIRVAHAETKDAPDIEGDILTASITAPEDGFLVITAGANAGGGDLERVNCRVEVDDITVTGSRRGMAVHWPGGSHTYGADEHCSPSGTQAVTAGTHNVSLHIEDQDWPASSITLRLFNASLSVIYVPFGPTGGPPSTDELAAGCVAPEDCKANP